VLFSDLMVSTVIDLLSRTSHCIVTAVAQAATDHAAAPCLCVAAVSVADWCSITVSPVTRITQELMTAM